MPPLAYPRWRPLWAKQAALFYEGLARQLQAGLTPAQAKLQADPKVVGPGFAALSTHLARRTAKGASLAEAMRAGPELVGPSERAALAAAEQAGQLPEALELLARSAQAQHQAQVAFATRLAYPLAVFGLALLISPLRLLVMVGPAAYLGAVLPGLMAYALALAGGLLLATSPAAAPWRARLLGRLCGLPGPGQALRGLAQARFFLLVGMGVEAGLGLAEAVAAAGRASLDPGLAQLARPLAGQLGRGVAFAEALQRHPDRVAPLWRQVVASGEEAGSLPEVLRRHAGLEEAEAHQRLGLWLWALAGAMGLALLGSVAFQILQQGRAALDPASRGALGEEGLGSP